MARRLQLHEKLCTTLGTRNVYFQPPASVKLNYDCIIYEVSRRNDLMADDKQYRNYIRYQVVLVYRDPDSDLPEKIMEEFPYCYHERHYTVDNLHHDVFLIYF